MSEPVLRLLVVAAATLAILLTVALLRRHSRRGWRKVRASGLAPGTYLFTSETCARCADARARLAERHGMGFTEVRWEEDPARFGSIGVVEVPSTLVVDADGSGRLYRLVPPS